MWAGGVGGGDAKEVREGSERAEAKDGSVYPKSKISHTNVLSGASLAHLIGLVRLHRMVYMMYGGQLLGITRWWYPIPIPVCGAVRRVRHILVSRIVVSFAAGRQGIRRGGSLSRVVWHVGIRHCFILSSSSRVHVLPVWVGRHCC